MNISPFIGAQAVIMDEILNGDVRLDKHSSPQHRTRHLLAKLLRFRMNLRSEARLEASVMRDQARLQEI